jgi:hypothetical protein
VRGLQRSQVPRLEATQEAPLEFAWRLAQHVGREVRHILADHQYRKVKVIGQKTWPPGQAFGGGTQDLLDMALDQVSDGHVSVVALPACGGVDKEESRILFR